MHGPPLGNNNVAIKQVRPRLASTVGGGRDIKMGRTAQHCTELDVLGLAEHVHQCPSFRGGAAKGWGVHTSSEQPLGREAYGIVSEDSEECTIDACTLCENGQPDHCLPALQH